MMPPLDWSQCPAVESIPGKCGGRWLLRDTRIPVQLVFENLANMSISEFVEDYDVAREDIEAVLQFVVRSLDLPPRYAQE